MASRGAEGTTGGTSHTVAPNSRARPVTDVAQLPSKHDEFTYGVYAMPVT
jgi:hypothetical protein